MNAVQMFYAREVLGVERVLQPSFFRQLYRIHYPPSSAPDILFFCTDMNQTVPAAPEEQKQLMGKMSAALKDREGQAPSFSVVEVLKPEAGGGLAEVFQSLLARLCPQKGVVVFDPRLALLLLNQTDPLIFETPKTPLRLKGLRAHLLPPGGLCVLKPLSRFFASSREEVQKTKQEAWVKLKNTFQKP